MNPTRDKVAAPTATNWNSAARTAAERKWNAKWVSFTQPASDLMLRELQNPPPARLLDIATGTGEPAVFFAKRLGPAAQIIGTDMATEILPLAQDYARQKNVGNVLFHGAPADSLPFPGDSFDAVTCRWGVMFFPDPVAALRECARVLRPGGRAIFTAWGPIQAQPFFLHTVGALRRHIGQPLDEPEGAPTPFRFPRAQALQQVFEAAGFVDVQGDIQTLEFVWPGPPREPWTFWTEITSSYRAPLDSLSPAELAALSEQAEAHYREYFDGSAVRLPAQVVWASGVRP